MVLTLPQRTDSTLTETEAGAVVYWGLDQRGQLAAPANL